MSVLKTAMSIPANSEEAPETVSMIKIRDHLQGKLPATQRVQYPFESSRTMELELTGMERKLNVNELVKTKIVSQREGTVISLL